MPSVLVSLSPIPSERSPAHLASHRDWQEMPPAVLRIGSLGSQLAFFFSPSLLALLTSLRPSCSGSLPHCQPLSLLLKVNSGTSIADAERSFLKGCCDWGTRLCFVPGLPCLPAPLCSSPAASPHRGVFLALQGADGAMLQQQQPPAAVGRRAGDGNAAHGEGRSLRRCAETPRSRR